MKDLAGDDETTSKLEFSVMVIGGAASLKPKDGEEVEPKVATGPHGAEVVKTEEFWSDLNGYLTQRLKDEHAASKYTAIFKKAAAGA